MRALFSGIAGFGKEMRSIIERNSALQPAKKLHRQPVEEFSFDRRILGKLGPPFRVSGELL
jgi:hypothetical protein